MSETHLTGLEGTNPLAFLAALGVQVAFASETQQPRLWWSSDITPHAVVDGDYTIERIFEHSLQVFNEWRTSPVLTPSLPDGSPMKKGDELKLASPDIRTFLAQARQADSAGTLSTALVAEGSLDNNGAAKPTDLYFTAGQQKFLAMVRKVFEGVTHDDLYFGLQGPWKYASKLPSLMWDVSDDRVYALTSTDPSKDKKLTNPGPEALAVLGLSLHPVFAGRDRTLTQGCSGSWKYGNYSWPLWSKPASPHMVKSLLAHAYDLNRHQWFRSWGVFRILQSAIRRSDQGGYGTFGPPEVVWEAR